MVNLSQIAPLDMNSAYLPASSGFRSFADLDGAHAAAFLRDNGATNVVCADIGTNGLAIGEHEGAFVLLSTNGCLSHHSVLTPAAARLVERLSGARS